MKGDDIAKAQALKPVYQRQVFDRGYLIFDGADRTQLAKLGEVRTPNLADLFVALMGPEASQ